MPRQRPSDHAIKMWEGRTEYCENCGHKENCKGIVDTEFPYDCTRDECEEDHEECEYRVYCEWVGDDVCSDQSFFREDWEWRAKKYGG